MQFKFALISLITVVGVSAVAIPDNASPLLDSHSAPAVPPSPSAAVGPPLDVSPLSEAQLGGAASLEMELSGLNQLQPKRDLDNNFVHPSCTQSQ
ncbi:hypothetical protein CVT24_011244 [Panaeolus cyanescens]|uniref:Uncharacterized protein n=1 Tax=Panaeolus cyanescens TaxID=181874 RepID=A0A409YGH6_9AGAR|nr:hypothetical protein CVT24_011244 [Panaeolus cyanescens]